MRSRFGAKRAGLSRWSLSTLEEGDPASEECLPEFIPLTDRAVVHPQAPRQLSTEEVALVAKVFRSILIHDAPAPPCRGCAIDPCVINAAEWLISRTPLSQLYLSDYICASRNRLDPMQVAELIALLAQLRQEPT